MLKARSSTSDGLDQEHTRSNIQLCSLQDQCFKIYTTYVTIDWGLLVVPLVLSSLETFSNFVYPGLNFSHLLTRSNCSPKYFRHLCLYGNTYKQDNTPNLEFTQLLLETPKVDSLATGYIAPPALISLIHGGLLPQPLDIDWVVMQEGLCPLLGLLDIRRTQQSPLPKFRA